MIHLSTVFKHASCFRSFIIRRSVSGRSYEDLLAGAKALEKTHQISRAQELYWEIMKQHPTQEESYKRLWHIWVETCSLRVPGQELDDFIAMYKKNIDPD